MLTAAEGKAIKKANSRWGRKTKPLHYRSRMYNSPSASMLMIPSLICTLTLRSTRSGQGHVLKRGSLKEDDPANSSVRRPRVSSQLRLWKQMAHGPKLLYCQSLRGHGLAPC